MRQQFGHVEHRRLLAVHHAEPVGHECRVVPDQFHQGLGQRRALGGVLAGLARIETDVLQQQDVAIGQALGAGQRVGAHHIAGKLHVPTEALTESLGHRGQGEFGIRRTLGPAQVCGHDDLGPGVRQCLQGG